MHNQRGQTQIIIGIAVILVIVGIYFGFRFLGGPKEGQIGKEETVENPDDTASPARSNLLPAGILSLNTKEVNLSLNTNEPAYCRYSTEAGQSFNDMSRGFSLDKKKTSHNTKVTGLKNGQTYKYYVRCRDLAGNKNTEDALIEFSVGAAVPGNGGSAVISPSPAEAPPVRSNLLPAGTLSSGTTKITISLLTSEPAYCRYSIDPETTFDNMNKGFSTDKSKLQHTAAISGLTDNKIYEYFVRCRDLKNNKNNDDAVIRFGVGGVAVIPGQALPPGSDITPPNRFDASPSKDLPAGTSQTSISLKTDEVAVCRYGDTAGSGYDSMKTFSNTNSTSHLTGILGLSEGSSYKFYIKCADQRGNKNTNDFIISFKVEAAEDKTPPILSHPSHTGNVLPADTTEAVMSVSTNEAASCRYSTTGGTAYNSMSGRFSYYDQTKKFHVKTVTGLKGGTAYDFFVRCQDTAGNSNTGDVLINFSVAR